MKQTKNKILAIAFACPADIEVNDMVEIAADLAVAKPTAAASVNMVGRVETHLTDALECTVATRFRERRDDREAAEVGLGAFVWDAAMKAILYTEAVYGTVLSDNAQPYAPVAIVSVAGSGTEPFLPVLDTTDKVKIKVGTAESQTFTLAVTDTTAQLIADKLNATAVGFVASAVAGAVVLTALAAGDAIAIETILHDDYTELGFTVASTPASYKLMIKIGAGADQTFLLANTDTTAALVCAKINATAVGFIAEPTSANKVKITSLDLQDAIEIKAIALDCYTILGFTVAVTEPTERSHDPGAIAGLIIKQPQPLVVTGTAPGPFTIANGSNDALKIKVGDGESQVFDLPTGANEAADIVDTINLTATGFTASAVDGKVALTLDDAATDLEFEAVANSAYATLGFTEGVCAAPMTIETLEK